MYLPTYLPLQYNELTQPTDQTEVESLKMWKRHQFAPFYTLFPQYLPKDDIESLKALVIQYPLINTYKMI